MNENPTSESRRWFVKAGALTSGALTLGLSGSAAAQQTETPTETPDGGQPNWRQALMFSDEFFTGAVFRVVSPVLDDAPGTETPSAVEDWTVRVIEYFNTNQEEFLFVPPDQSVDQGELYRLGDRFVPATNGAGGLMEVEYRPLDVEDFPFDLEEGEEFELLDEGGGEAAVRPRDFFTNTLFRVTSGPQGWVPEDVENSGFFTDYNTVHAEYLGVDDEFLFFPQEGAEVQVGNVYVLWDEFEFFDPAGRLVAAEFEPVDEESITVDDEFL